MITQIGRAGAAVSAVALTLALLPAAAAAQRIMGGPDMPPVNDRPNPYRTIAGWAKMPEGRTWGSTSAVAIDRDGVSVWVGERCGANSCASRPDLDVILKFDANGNLVTSFGKGMVIFPHGMHVDRDGNVWITDGQSNRPGGRGGADQPPPERLYGMQVFKFSPTGQLLLTLGEQAGIQGEDGYFWQPNDVLVAPDGSIFVSEGHGDGATTRSRVLKFNPQGQLIKTFGSHGTENGQFRQPHALAMDSQGRLFVGDRSNNRIQIFDQEGNLLEIWYQFSRPSGIFIDANDNIYVADSESGSVNRQRTDWKRGMRVGSARTGEVQYFIPDPAESPPSTSSAEGVAVDRNGVIYGAEVGDRALKRYVR
jgi:sugar lactone lactonase YvrE